MSVGVTAAEIIYEAAERLPPDLAVLIEPPYIPEVSISALLPSYALGRRQSLVLQSDSRSELAVDRLLGFQGAMGMQAKVLRAEFLLRLHNFMKVGALHHP